MNLLWQKDLKNHGLYKDIFQTISAKHNFQSNLEVNSTITEKMSLMNLNEKSDKISSETRSEGNIKFKEKEWLEAMSLYNESLCYAEIGSENISLAYANRSACFLLLKLYDECLVDIEFAKQASYPENLMPKLDKRREDCLQLMATYEGKHKLSYEADDKFPGMANVLELRCDKKFGRQIVAKCDIPVGKIILAEKAFIARSLNTDYNHCATCMKMSTNFIPCNHCTDVLFCNSGCANANDMHKIDCGKDVGNIKTNGPLEYYIGTICYFIRTFETVESLIEFVEDALKKTRIKPPNSLNDTKSKFKAVLQLSKNSNPTEKMIEEHLREACIIYNNLQFKKSIKILFETEEKKRFLMHLVLHLKCVAHNNGFTASGTKMSLYIIASYFNHACASNVSGLNTDENVRYCRTNRPIKAGQQLFIMYTGDLFCESSVEYYQQFLYENFGFRCECERCKPNMISWEMNSYRMQLDQDYQIINSRYNEFMNDGVGTIVEKRLFLEKKVVEILTRYGDKHWCDELAATIEFYDTFFV